MKAIPPSEPNVIRFAVGTDAAPTSFIWRLWTSDDDAYLLPTSLPQPKFSMHGDVWKIDAGKARHRFGPIACDNAPGWVQGPAAMFCHVPYDPAAPPEGVLTEARTRRNIRWFDKPPEWHLREFVVFFAGEDVDSAQLPPMDTDGGILQAAIGPLSLTTGKRVWLRTLQKPIPEDRKQYVLSIRKTVTGLQIEKGSQPLRSIGIVMHLHQSTAVCVPFGLETIVTK